MSLRRPSLLRVLSALPLLWLLAGPALAQSGEVAGRITGPDGAPLPGASVVLEAANPAADQAPTGTATGSDGTYALTVPAGTYRLTASMLGYAPGVVEGVIVEAGARLTVDVALSEAAYDLDEVVVQATRMEIPLSAVSGSVTVVDAEELRTQQAAAQNTAELLAQVVPGLGVATGTPSIYGQSLRGRTISVMIDGVPQSTTRNTSRDLTTLDPSMIERVEVIRGATSIYGDGATGGIINIITRRPVPGAALRFTTDVETGGALTALGDGLQGRLTQTVTGTSGPLAFTAGLSAAQTGGFYDAEGDLIPPDPYGQGGLASTASYDVHGKLAYTAGPQRLQLSVNHFLSEQETAYVTDPAVDARPAGEAKARAMEGLEMEENQGTDNTVASLAYDHAELLGGRLHAQLFHRTYETRFRPFDGRPYASYGAIIQSYLASKKTGGRLEFERPLVDGLTVLAGADYTDERTQQPVYIMDPEAFDASGGLVYRTIDERPWVPLMNPRQLGLFTQLAWSPVAALDLQGGVRYERARLHVADFTTLIGGQVTGGEVAYDPVLFNAGAVLQTSGSTSVYASFSQGFSLTDLGLLLRSVPDAFVVGERTLKAQKVTGYEAGARLFAEDVRATVAGFYTTSSLGTTSAGLDQGVVRAPERVYGLEATLDAEPLEALRLGGTFTWTEGENDPDEDGTYLALNTFRIQPLKVTAYAEHATRPGWTNRLQVLYSGARDRAFVDAGSPETPGFGLRPVERYVVLDLISTLDLGPGTLRVGVSNLLNNQYFPVVSQLLWNGRNSSRAAAPGARLTLGYTVTY